MTRQDGEKGKEVEEKGRAREMKARYQEREGDGDCDEGNERRRRTTAGLLDD